jgi:hypothetical protein
MADVGQLDAEAGSGMSDEKKAILESLEAHYGIVTDACKKIGLARSTFYNWLKTDSSFKAAVDEIQEVALDFVEGKLFERINGVMMGSYDQEGELKIYQERPSDQAIALYLKTKGKKRGYVERQELAVEGQLGITWNEQKTYETKDDQSPDMENKSL